MFSKNALMSLIGQLAQAIAVNMTNEDTLQQMPQEEFQICFKLVLSMPDLDVDSLWQVLTCIFNCSKLQLKPPYEVSQSIKPSESRAKLIKAGTDENVFDHDSKRVFYYKNNCSYQIYMSNWKRLAQKNRDLDSSYSGSKHQRYTPKKSTNNENNSSRFHNLTLMDKMSQSGVSDDKEKLKERNFVDRQTQANQPRVLKVSSSQVKLHRDTLMQPKNSLFIPKGSFIMNLPDDHDNRNRRSYMLPLSPLIKKCDKNMLFEELQKLKKQFTTFQTIVFNELRKQQKLINQMFQQIYSKMQEVNTIKSSQFQRPAKSHIQLQKFNMTPNLRINNGDYKKNINQNILPFTNPAHITPKVNKSMTTGNKPNLSLKVNEGFECPSQFMKKREFNKFFEAVENLKRDIKDLNQISDISSIASPKSTMGKHGWQNWSKALKTQP